MNSGKDFNRVEIREEMATDLGKVALAQKIKGPASVEKPVQRGYCLRRSYAVRLRVRVAKVNRGFALVKAGFSPDLRWTRAYSPGMTEANWLRRSRAVSMSPTASSQTGFPLRSFLKISKSADGM
jgi:hypothetical protein